jgi:hypothetical protein
LLRHLLAVFGGRAEVTSRSDVRRHGAIYGGEALGVPWRLEPLHAALALTGGLVRVFRPVIQVAMLAMFHTRQDLALRRTIARQSFVNLWSVELSISRKVHDCLGQLSLEPIPIGQLVYK